MLRDLDLSAQISKLHNMLEILENIELKNYTTFKVGGKARFFVRLKNKSEILEMVKFAKENSIAIFILGGGSNIIVSDKDLNILVIKNEILGREILSEDDSEVIVSVGAGENWDEFTGFCVERGFSGIEALSAIPGTVGGAPIQNIGAYGAEAGNTIESVLVYNTEKEDFETLSNLDCKFSYRDSVFKKFPGKFIVLEVVFKLYKNQEVVVPNYPGVMEKLLEKNILNPKLADVRQIITEIRANKLPDPKLIPNVGSFFKNPIVSRETFEGLRSKFPSIKYFEAGIDFKIPAGWLIETAGLKGADLGKVRTYQNNALVLVNNGEANTEDVLVAQEKITSIIEDKFGIKLEREPILVD